MTMTKSVVQTIAGDSGTANDHMMEVEEETSVTASGTNLQPQSTVGIHHAHTQDMEDEEEPMTAMQGAQATQEDDVDQLTETLHILHQLDTPLNTVARRSDGSLAIDMDTLGQDAFDLAGSTPAGWQQDCAGPGTWRLCSWP